MSEDEDMITWQDTLDLIQAGRVSNLQCPFCKKGLISITKKERVTRIACASCRKFIEGSMGEE